MNGDGDWEHNSSFISYVFTGIYLFLFSAYYYILPYIKNMPLLLHFERVYFNIGSFKQGSTTCCGAMYTMFLLIDMFSNNLTFNSRTPSR